MELKGILKNNEIFSNAVTLYSKPNQYEVSYFDNSAIRTQLQELNSHGALNFLQFD